MYSLLIPLFVTAYVLQSAIANPVSKSSEGNVALKMNIYKHELSADPIGRHGEPFVNSAMQQRGKRYYGYHSWFYPGFGSWGYYPGYYRRVYYHYPFYAWGK
ncbi:hypothetical protein M514_05329 [Trichuris suis]|uniref:Uncharacterized protein n=1 Tax=Trichuris suis TaxID=68888 RepID=A0A085NQ69_9BILA|nr:hypothetical protein M513_05329 [Trichuris suis]KFD71615.1 hypothetical protein M514_05329 [Trichuris suis]KHJ42206.1 hypothetical protein D918_07738 [Trichuris suis]